MLVDESRRGLVSEEDGEPTVRERVPVGGVETAMCMRPSGVEEKGQPRLLTRVFGGGSGTFDHGTGMATHQWVDKTVTIVFTYVSVVMGRR